MPRQRNTFTPVDLLKVYDSPSGMRDTRTGDPYQAGGLMVGIYLELTEEEALMYGRGIQHEGQYRFVQIDSTATAANMLRGSIALMTSLALGVNNITSYDQGLNAAIRPVVILTALTAAQIAAGAYVWVQEQGDATVLGPTGGVSNANPAVGDVINSIATGRAEDLATPGTPIATTIGVALTAPDTNATATFRCLLDLPVIQD